MGNHVRVKGMRCRTMSEQRVEDGEPRQSDGGKPCQNEGGKMAYLVRVNGIRWRTMSE